MVGGGGGGGVDVDLVDESLSALVPVKLQIHVRQINF